MEKDCSNKTVRKSVQLSKRTLKSIQMSRRNNFPKENLVLILACPSSLASKSYFVTSPGGATPIVSLSSTGRNQTNNLLY